MTEQTPQSPIEQPTHTTFVQQEQKAPVKAGWILLITCWLCYLVPIPGLGLLGMALNFTAFIVSIIVITRGKTGMGIVLLAGSVLFSTAIYFIGLAVFAGAVNEVMNYKY